MRRNSGWPCVPARVVDDLVSAVTARLAVRHPSVGVPVVDSVVYQAAAELVSTIADPERLGRLLDRRADARLAAMTGSPVAITSDPPARQTVLRERASASQPRMIAAGPTTSAT